MRNRPWITLLPPAATVVLLACGSDSAERVVGPSTQAVAVSSQQGSEWSQPVHVGSPISSPARELAARLSPDELSLYLASDRPGGLGAVDIWVSRRACLECSWEVPVNLGSNINSGGGDGGPVLSGDGHLLFFSGSRAGGHGGEDIWMSRRKDKSDDLGWGPAINLGPGVNTATDEQGPAYVPALAGGGATLYFNRGGDIYQVRVTRHGVAEGSAVPVADLNHPTANDREPTVRRDGREILFWSTRPGGLGGTDIWVATRPSVHAPWSIPQPLGPPVNTSFIELAPGLSHDGRTLLFPASAGRGGLGFQDIWMSTRTRAGDGRPLATDDR